jgi:Protein of unknown function (DUF3034)
MKRTTFARLATALAWLGMAHAAGAQTPLDRPYLPDMGKLPLTAGFNDIDGAGGAGLVPLAFITGYGSESSFGANAHYTWVPLRDFRLQSYGLAVGALDRVEVSYAHDAFDVTSTALEGVSVAQNILGVKVRLIGNAVYDQDSWIPQTAIGLEYKRNTGLSNAGMLSNVEQLGARSDSGTDYYLAATRLFLAQSLLVNLTLRYTNANEFGLLGFGGDLHEGRTLRPEVTVAYLLTRKVAAGLEYRDRPHNLSVDDENGAYDAFIAWTPTRNVSVVAAYVRLGSILAPVTGVGRNQDGAYISLQAGF